MSNRAVGLAWVMLAALALGCGNKDDDDRPHKSQPPAATPPATPPAPATVAAEPPQDQPATPPAAQPAPAAPAPSGTAKPAATGQGKKAQPSPIPTQLIPKPLQPLVPKVPAGLPIPQ